MRILHTNDLHGALRPEDWARLAELRRSVDLWVDCGDAVGSPRPREGPEPNLVALRAAGCDLFVPGNHEFLHLGDSPELSEAPPVICANLLDARTGRAAFPPSAIREIGGSKVGFVGATVPFLKLSDRPPRRLADAVARFEDRFRLVYGLDLVMPEAKRLKESCDAVIMLAHFGRVPAERYLAKHSPIDVFLGGHAHEERPPHRWGRGWFAENAPFGRSVGVYEWKDGTLSDLEGPRHTYAGVGDPRPP